MIKVLIGLLNFLKQCLLFCFRGRMVVSIGDCIRMTRGRVVIAEIYKYGKESFLLVSLFWCIKPSIYIFYLAPQASPACSLLLQKICIGKRQWNIYSRIRMSIRIMLKLKTYNLGFWVQGDEGYILLYLEKLHLRLGVVVTTF